MQIALPIHQGNVSERRFAGPGFLAPRKAGERWPGEAGTERGTTLCEARNRSRTRRREKSN
ncbi:MAG: hypothetical protein E5V91_18930 [Mesorhizobium sp.]|nr:hypothetical protein EJ068_04405 [Mesorhizobium sp. M2A.F.Ca.ET.043.02.1.1]RUW41143.1 hypothetical protein EOA37_11385 [Mesorhizobium sp. M2A.F.Ca.ET.015.02.1.1]RUW73951.1 hypothetical protein EOA28_17870 [Mesorhizobium sp. M2A.F.Ca.ET.067.02.1.1]RVD05770.1 hypothetical protein EN753_19205 [Mesorhizobium sp. M2A.F.Ca.ET.029.05.1.1]RWB46402.1 MAG: hypothetical protein EOQ46_08965 [Mesorhizobium sp.]